MVSNASILDGRYRVIRLVGEGGFGAVYAGVHLSLGAPVAIKVLKVRAGAGAARRCEDLERLLDEGRLLTRLRHPNIVAALDMGIVHDEREGASPYLVMEWVEGVTLREHLDAAPRALTPIEAWRLLEPLGAALAHAHAAQIAHRDLTPSNVMVVRDAAGALVPRLIDFGVAQLLAPDTGAEGGDAASAQPNGFTLAYAAPEQILRSSIGPWTDVHALGLLFIELLTGAPPYGHAANARQSVLDPQRPSPRAHGIDVGKLEPVLARALALRPADRYANAADLLEALRHAFETPRPPRRTRTARIPSRIVLLVSAAALVAAAVVRAPLAGGAPNPAAEAPRLAAEVSSTLARRDGEACLRALDAAGDLAVPGSGGRSDAPTATGAGTRARCLMLSGRCSEGKALYRAWALAFVTDAGTAEVLDSYFLDDAVVSYCEGDDLSPRDALRRDHDRLRGVTPGLAVPSPARCRAWHEGLAQRGGGNDDHGLRLCLARAK